MALINVESHSDGYIILDIYSIEPFSSGVINDINFVNSEFKSLRNLCDIGKIKISKVDYDYVLQKILNNEGYKYYSKLEE